MKTNTNKKYTVNNGTDNRFFSDLQITPEYSGH